MNMEKNDDIMVSILTLAYNHEPYIRQCLDGIVMQRTNFRFELLIHDDASTDETANIIREYEKKYPDIIKPIFQKENQYSKKVPIGATYLYPRAKGKYIALCEGDDYWTDPYKLQKQVDFLENHPEYSLIYTQARIFMPDGQFSKKVLGSERDFQTLLCIGNTIPTLTTCFRKTMYFNYIKDTMNHPQWEMGDYPLWLYISYHSKIKFLPNQTGVYRILEESVSHSKNPLRNLKFIFNKFQIQEYFAHYAKYDHELKIITQNTFNFILNYSIETNQKYNFKFWYYVRKYKITDISLFIKYIFSLSYVGRKLTIYLWNINTKVYKLFH